MNKGIIVVDILKYCDYCPVGRIFGFESGVECLVAPEGHCVSGYGFHIEKPNWCPIKLIKRKPGETRYQNEFEKGWNACIDEILKGGEEDARP